VVLLVLRCTHCGGFALKRGMHRLIGTATPTRGIPNANEMLSNACTLNKTCIYIHANQFELISVACFCLFSYWELFVNNDCTTLLCSTLSMLWMLIERCCTLWCVIVCLCVLLWEANVSQARYWLQLLLTTLILVTAAADVGAVSYTMKDIAHAQVHFVAVVVVPLHKPPLVLPTLMHTASQQSI
jgi:hypothetical protein